MYIMQLKSQESIYSLELDGSFVEIKYDVSQQTFINNEYSILQNEYSFHLLKKNNESLKRIQNAYELSPEDNLILSDLGLSENISYNNNEQIDISIDEDVQKQIDIYNNSAFIEKMKIRSEALFPIFETVLSDYNLPQALKYLPIIESALQADASSQAGATGLWQFMKNTAIQMGLKVNNTKDERKNIQLSSEAAARYLYYLYNKFGDWKLTLAAYNAGEGTVQQAIVFSEKSTFEDIKMFLPKETQVYVPRFIAMYHIFNIDEKQSLSLVPVFNSVY